MLLQQLVAAKNKLKEALNLEPTEFHKLATIQIFEITFELSWKYIQQILQFSGVIPFNSPRKIIRQAGKVGLVDDVTAWLNLVDARNITVHTYDEYSANQVYKKLNSVPELVDKLLQKAKEFNQS
ncbi:nucleotidyltransferase substrate binding protein [Patescibacteria group bacterium]|nr:nucleotidyltransferase substrate binding protein [Patescibacteria group bacterium]